MLVRENVGKVATFLFALENSRVSLTFHLGLIVF
jgi:hypothetical protein